MKRFFCLVLLIIFCFSAVSCGKDPADKYEKYDGLIELLEDGKYEKAIEEIRKLEDEAADDTEEDTEGDTGTAEEETTDEALEDKYLMVSHWLENGYLYTSTGEWLSSDNAVIYVYNLLQELGNYKDSAEILSRFSILPEALRYITKVNIDAFGQTSESEYKRFTYDENGELFELTERADLLALLFGVPEHNDNNLEALKLYDASADYEYDGSGRIVKGTFYDSYSGSSEGEKTIHAVMQVEYNANGKPVKADFQHTSGKTWTNNYTYDESNRLKKAEGTYYFQLSADIFSKYVEEYEYDTNGNLIKKIRWIPEYGTTDYGFANQYNYEYDENGRLMQIKSYRYDVFGVLEPDEKNKKVFNYDDNGRISYVEVTDNWQDPPKVTYYECTYEEVIVYNGEA
ncbi:MAG: hypothetical protein IJD22_05125 [Clostridia bacterium]|nr:hypothetical protein [Clostridia bacterium]